MSVPASIPEVDAAWLQRAFALDPRVQHTRWNEIELRRVGVGFGLDGELVQVTLPGSALGSAVVKLAQNENPGREVHFFNALAPRMPIRVPFCFHAAVDADVKRSVLVLEDLSDADQGDCTKGVGSRARAEALVAALARFHGMFWGADDPALQEYPEWGLNLGQVAEKWDAHWERCVARYGATWSEGAGWDGAGGAQIAVAMRKVPGLVARAVDVSSRATLTLAHADCHLDNVLFLGDEPVILDWVGARRGPGPLDFARIMVEGLSATERRAWQRDLFALYLDTLDAATDVTLDRHQLSAELAAYSLWGVVFGVAWAGREKEDRLVARVPAIVASLLRNAIALVVDDGLAALE